MKLYSNPMSRGVTVEWYIQEISANVDIVNVDMYGTKEHKKPEFLKINPFGRVPALEDGDLTMSESGAILLYLLDKCGGGDKMPAAQRGKIMQWVLFANSTLEEAAFGPKRDVWLPEVMTALDQLLAAQPYLLGDEFSVADVAVGATMTWLPMMVPQADTAPYKNIVAYLKRLQARPACANTLMKAMSTPPPAAAAP